MDWLPNLADSSQWNVIAVRTLTQQRYRVAIAPQEFIISGAIATVETNCFDAPMSWHTGGWVASFLLFGSSRVEVSRQVLALSSETLIVLPKVSGVYLLQVTFPRWIPQLRLIVREFIGEDLRPGDVLARIEQKFDALNP